MLFLIENLDEAALTENLGKWCIPGGVYQKHDGALPKKKKK